MKIKVESEKIIKAVDPPGQGHKEYLNLQTPLYGRHNISNLLSAIVLADYLGSPPSRLPQAVKTFRGIRRRQEIIGEKKGRRVKRAAPLRDETLYDL